MDAPFTWTAGWRCAALCWLATTPGLQVGLDPAAPLSSSWEALEPGLELARLRVPGSPSDVSPVVSVVRVDPIHVRAPYATHDLIELLLRLPLGLRRLMYVEGGPEASLYVKVGERVAVSEVGSYETGFFESDENRRFWPLPNVLAVVAR